MICFLFFGLLVVAASVRGSEAELAFMERVMSGLNALQTARAQPDSVALLNGRVAIVGVGTAQLDSVSELFALRLASSGPSDAVFTVGLLPATVRLDVLLEVFGLPADETRLRLAHNFVVEEIFDVLDLFLSGLIEQPAWSAGAKQQLLELIADEDHLLHLLVPALVPRSTDDDSGLLHGDAGFVDYAPLLRALLDHLEQAGAAAPLPTGRAELDDEKMWFAFFNGLLDVALDTLEHAAEPAGAAGGDVLWRNTVLIERLRKIVDAAQLGASITAAANWLNAQNLHTEWRARLAVGTALLDEALLNDADASITFVVPHHLAEALKSVVSLHGADARLRLDKSWSMQQQTNKEEL